MSFTPARCWPGSIRPSQPPTWVRWSPRSRPLQAQVSRMQAEIENRPFTYAGLDPNMAFQAAIYGQRQAEFNFKLENYRQKADSLTATLARAHGRHRQLQRPPGLRQDPGTDAPRSGASERRVENQHPVGDGHPSRDAAGNLDNARQQQRRGPTRPRGADRRTQRLISKAGTTTSATS